MNGEQHATASAAFGDMTSRFLRHPFLLLFLIAIAVHGRVLFNVYTYDAVWLYERLAPPQAEPVTLAAAFDPALYGEQTGIMSYRPVTLLTFQILDARLFGGTAALSHAINLLLHVTSGWLLFRLLFRWLDQSGSRWARQIAFLGSCMLLVHPLVTEAVYCMGFRFDVLALTFILATLNLAMLLFQESPPPDPLVYTLLVLGFLLALFSKESGVILLPLVPLCLLLMGGGWRRTLVVAGSMFIAFLGFFLVWKKFQYAGYPGEYLGGGGRILGMANFLTSSVEVYLVRLVWPWPLRVDYAFEPATTLFSARQLRAVAVLVLFGAPACLMARKNRLCLFGLMWVLFGFLPVSQVLPVPDPVAERFAYIPMAGLCIFLAGGIQALAGWRPDWFRGVVAIAAALLLVWGAVSHRRSWDWRDDVRLNIANWEQAGDTRPVALRSLGSLYLAEAARLAGAGEADGARQYYAKSRAALEGLLVALPDDSEGLRLMAVWHLSQNQPDEARGYYRRAVEADPDNPMLAPLAQALDTVPRPETPE